MPPLLFMGMLILLTLKELGENSLYPRKEKEGYYTYLFKCGKDLMLIKVHLHLVLGTLVLSPLTPC